FCSFAFLEIHEERDNQERFESYESNDPNCLGSVKLPNRELAIANLTPGWKVTFFDVPPLQLSPVIFIHHSAQTVIKWNFTCRCAAQDLDRYLCRPFTL